MKKNWLKNAAIKYKNWSVYKIAKELEVSQQTAYSWDNVRTKPGYEYLQRLCQLLGCTATDILGF